MRGGSAQRALAKETAHTQHRQEAGGGHLTSSFDHRSAAERQINGIHNPYYAGKHEFTHPRDDTKCRCNSKASLPTGARLLRPRVTWLLSHWR